MSIPDSSGSFKDDYYIYRCIFYRSTVDIIKYPEASVDHVNHWDPTDPRCL